MYTFLNRGYHNMHFNIPTIFVYYFFFLRLDTVYISYYTIIHV